MATDTHADTPGGADERLNLEQLAYEAESSPERIRQLVEIGAIVPGPDGRFSRGDVARSRSVAAFEASGFSIEQMATAIRERETTLNAVDLFYPDPGPRAGRSYAEFVEALGPRGRLVTPALQAMGLSAPLVDAPTRVAEEALLAGLLEAWSSVDEEYTLRAARIFGNAARQAAEGWAALFNEAISGPVEAQFHTLEETQPRLVKPATDLTALAPKLLPWLLMRHLERTMNELNIARIEARLERRGLIATRPSHPPAVAFVDVTGYTRLTATGGDELGARMAVRLGELAASVVAEHGGRVVKLLGDGVLLRFDSVCAGVDVVARLMKAMAESDLPPAHAGIHTGSLVERDGDIYGTTVNAASRIATFAQPGELLASTLAMQECPDLADQFQPVGDVELKGLTEPISLGRWLG